jgi:pimeloyl-ACP methyl ester carboxylesterase
MRTPFALIILTLAMIPNWLLSRQLVADDLISGSVGDRESAAFEGASEPDGRTAPQWNLPLKTAGGTQFWTDHLYRSGYRIQQNALTGHWRLLDSNDVRRAWGTRGQCQSVLDGLQPETSKSPKNVVVLIHGLMRTHHSMKPLELGLTDLEDAELIRFSYASTRSSIGNHAAALREVLEGFPANTRFSFVGHSMGNIVVRHLVGDLQRERDPHGVLVRCRSMVMLGPPNQGAAIARRLAPTGLYEMITGKGGMELGVGWQDFAENLATPPFPFAIIAGDLNQIQNPLVDGSSDFVVSVEEARLAGSESFERVAVLHSVLMNDESVKKRTSQFIKSH